MPADSQRDVIIGPLKLNRRDRSLSRNGVAIPLGGRALDVLGVLAESAGETVGKDDLLNRVWPGLTVEENNLQVQISTLRKALGEGWILTIPGRGYQLALPPGGAGSPPADELLSRGASIAVLPFVNNSGDAEQAYFTDGVTEEIITVLSRVRWLSVIAQNSSFTYRDKAIDVKQIGQELGVRYVLKGSVRRSGDRIRITGQLIDAVTEANLWADRFEGTLDDIFDLQDCFAGCVVGKSNHASSLLKSALHSASVPTTCMRMTCCCGRCGIFRRSAPTLSVRRRVCCARRSIGIRTIRWHWHNWRYAIGPACHRGGCSERNR